MENTKKHYIYMIFNFVNNKIYLGKSNNPSKRWTDHKRVALGGKEKYKKQFSLVHSALRKYGVKYFSFEIVDEYNTDAEAYAAEIDWIASFKSNNTKYGYNLTLGGEGACNDNGHLSMVLKKYWEEHPNLKEQNSKRLQETKKRKPECFSKFDRFKGHSHTKKSRDKISSVLKKNEANVGTKNGSNKLTELQVIEIRNKYIPYAYSRVPLSKEYNISGGTVEDIINRKIWKHLDLTEKEKERLHTHKKRPKINKDILSYDQVKEIRAKYIPHKYTANMLAKEYNVKPSYISDIVSGKSYFNV